MSAILKTVKKYGNSGGVYVPRGWIGSKVKIELIEEPIDLKADLSKLPLEHIVSAIIYGSHARGEVSKQSDIDLILVTDDDSDIKIPIEIKRRYDTQVMTLKALRNAVAHDPVFHATLKNEAVAILNHKFLDDVTKGPVNLDGIKLRLELIESSLNIIKRIIDLDAHSKDVIYPLILRLREIILIDSLLSNRKYSTKLFKSEVTGYGISEKELSHVMETYRAFRDDKKTPGYKISKNVIENLASLLEMKLQHVKQKAHKKGY